MGSDQAIHDMNPIIYEGSPTSTAELSSVAMLCNVFGMKRTLEEPRPIYNR